MLSSREDLIATFQSLTGQGVDGARNPVRSTPRTASPTPYLYLVEWGVESDRVALHQLHQPESVRRLTVTELLRYVAPSDRKYVKRLVTYLIEGELERCEVEFRMINSSGKVRWMYGKGAVQYQPGKQLAKVIGLVTDIQAKERIFEAPGLTHPYFDQINGLPVGIIRFDLSTGAIDTANPAASLILQLPSATTVHSFPDINTADWVSVLELLRKQKQVLNKPLRLPSLDRWVLFSGHCDAEGQVTAVFQDITDIKEESISLQKVNTELDNFVYHASHDLRSPLRAILGSLELLKREDNPAERTKCVELIEGSINRLDTFITDLLSISRNQRRENPLVPINFMVEVETSVAGAYHVGSTQNLEIVTKISQPCPFVADLTRVRVILNNLIANAIKYRRYNTRRSYVLIEVWVSTKRAHLKIADNGEGIAEEKVDRIFDMFYRASERSEGSGLGLYIVRDVVQKLGGTISVRSRAGRGTTFTLSFPNCYKKNRS